jgi:hypothetical protein
MMRDAWKTKGLGVEMRGNGERSGLYQLWLEWRWNLAALEFLPFNAGEEGVCLDVPLSSHRATQTT